VYFVTTKLEGYILFSMTPSELAGMGLTEQHEVHVLERASQSGAWQVIARWKANDFSHTDFMAAWHNKQEPKKAQGLLEVLPADLRGKVAAH
jgi:hypothetical protein